MRDNDGGSRDDGKREAAPVADKLREWLGWAVEADASDLHLIVGYPPVLRLHGDLTELAETPLGAEQARSWLCALCPPEALARFQTRKDVDFSFDAALGGVSRRFRANLFHTAGQVGACLRVIPASIPDFAWAGFPVELAERLAFLRD